jgi:hypothetical protein
VRSPQVAPVNYVPYVDLFDLPEPVHVDAPAWAAIELARDRLRRSWESNDFPETLGKAKELVETVAKVVVESAEGTVADEADYAPTVKSAHKALRRQPGVDLSQHQEVRAIAQAAQTMATSLGPLRNTFGTGHGRARVPDVSTEMVTLGVESALVWCRWALRRLAYLLADYPNDLVDAVNTGTTRAKLREKFDATALAQQPTEIQHRIGVAFGQQSSGGFGNATEVGVEPAIQGGFEDYPISYRRGLLEGMLLNSAGQVGLPEFYAPRFVSLLGSLPDREATVAAEHLSSLAEQAPWADNWRGSTHAKPLEVIDALRAEGARLTPAAAKGLGGLCEALSRTV